MAARKQHGRYSVEADNVDRAAPTVNAGLSLAQTLAERAKTSCTVRVKDALGKTAGYARRDEDGFVEVVRL